MIRQRQLAGFIGRRTELSAFRDNLARPPGDEEAEFIFHIYGPSGVGKSTLVRQWQRIAEEHGAVTALVDESVAGVVEAMESISGQLAARGQPFKELTRRLSLYRKRQLEAESALSGALPEAAAAPEPGPSPAGTLAAQAGLAGLGLVPGLGPVAGAMDPQQVARSAAQVRTLFGARFRGPDDVRLLTEPLQELSPALVEGLGKAAQHCPWVVLFFDTYEHTESFLDTWLRDLLVRERHGTLPVNVITVLAGQSRLAPAVWREHPGVVQELRLEVFTEAEARQFLTVRGVTNETVVEAILRLSGRLPVLVHLLAGTRPTTVDDIDDPSGTAVDLFLRGETDPVRRATALLCALPTELDEDVFGALVPAEAAGLYEWLRGRPFATDHGGRCRYHDVIRAPMLRLQRTQSPQQWQQQHSRLGEAFRNRRLAGEQDVARPPAELWDDVTWRENRLRETYHELCAQPRSGLPSALRLAVDACGHGVPTLRRWAQMLEQAGQDSGAAEVQEWAHRHLGHFEEALAAFERARTLDASNGWCWYETALVQRVIGDPEHEVSLERAAALLARAAAESSVDPRPEQANLFAVECARENWPQADAVLDTFLAARPEAPLLMDVLRDLEDVERAFAVDAARLEAYRGRVRAAREASAQIPFAP